MSSYNEVAGEINLVNFYTSLWIQSTPEISQYRILYCMYCGTPIMQTDGIVIQVIPGETPSGVGMVIMCRKKTCQAKYKIQGVVGNV